MPQLQFGDYMPQLVWLAITFIAFYLIMARMALPRIGAVIEERRDRIQRDLDAAEKLKAETEEALANYEQARAEARSKAHNIVQEKRQSVARELEQERAEGDREIAEMTATAEVRINTAKAEAMTNVSNIARDTVGAIVNRLIDADANDDEIAEAVAQAASKS